MAKTTGAAKTGAPKFSKAQLLRSARYETRRDLIGALLKDGARYSHEEVGAAIEQYMKGTVK